MAKKQCAICGKKCGFLDGFKIKDAYICFDCENIVKRHSDTNKILSTYMSELTLEQFKQLYHNKHLTIHNFYRTSKTEESLRNGLRNAKRCVNCNSICNSFLERSELADGRYVCSNCKSEIINRSSSNKNLNDILRDLTTEEFKKIYGNQSMTTKDIAHIKTEICGVIFDDTNKTIDFTLGNLFKDFLNSEEDVPYPLPYSSIVKYEYKEGEKSITKGGSGIGRAVVGGLLFGGTGAIVGAATKKHTYASTISSMFVFITFNVKNQLYVKKIKINGLLDNTIEYGDATYTQCIKKVQTLMSKLDDICSTYHNLENSTPPPQETNYNNFSSADEIRKYKQLMDDGIITEEEFNAKKKQLLGI